MRRFLNAALVVAMVACVSTNAFAQRGQGGQQGGRGQAGQQGGPGGGFGMMGGGMMGGGMMGGGMYALLANPDVQKELKLEEGQIKEITEARDKITKEAREALGSGERPDLRNMSEEDRAAFMEKMRKSGEETAKKMAEEAELILDPNQQERLMGIYLQVSFIDALISAPIMERIELSEGQKKELESTREKAMTEMREVMQEAFRGGDRDAIRTKMEEFRKGLDEKYMAVLSKTQQTKVEELKGPKFEMSMGGRQRGGGGDEGGRGQGGRGDRGRPETDR